MRNCSLFYILLFYYFSFYFLTLLIALFAGLQFYCLFAILLYQFYFQSCLDFGRHSTAFVILIPTSPHSSIDSFLSSCFHILCLCLLILSHLYFVQSSICPFFLIIHGFLRRKLGNHYRLCN